MLRRKIIDKLIDWKNKENKKPLMIEGMRQVGKTYIVQHFAKNYYKHYIYINFLLNEEYIKAFEGDLSVETIITKLKYFQPFQNLDINKDCLIILDEIQECSNALTSLKSFCIEHYDIIVTGSYLRTKYKDIKSFPIGCIEFMKLHPLDFEEFMWANGISDNKINHLKDSFLHVKEIDSIVHEQMIELFKQYILVGGMPEVVNQFIKTNSIYEARKIQKELNNAFIYDVSKYAKVTETQKIIEIFNSVIAQLTKENKKFMFSRINKNARSKWYYSSLSWLIDANVANKCVLVNKLDNPLNAYEVLDHFKVYMNDTGLMTGLLDDAIVKEIMFDQDCIYKGAIFENIISQTFNTNDYKLRYFTRNNTLEIDFILNKDDMIIPIEVKAGSNRSKSLSVLVHEHKEIYGIKFTKANIKLVDRILHLPWYLAWLV